MTLHIEITTRKLGGAKGQSDLLTLRLIAQDLELDFSKHIPLNVQPTGQYDKAKWSEKMWTEYSTNDTVSNVEVKEPSDMRDANRLIKICFAVKPGCRDWSGLMTNEWPD